MDLFEQISEGIKNAMKERDAVRRDTLRNVKKEFIEAKTAGGANGELSDSEALKIIAKMVKARTLPSSSSPEAVRTSPTKNWHKSR